MPEPYGSPEFRESLKYPSTRVGAMMQQIHDGLVRYGSFGDAVMENQFKRMGAGKPGEKPLEPITFNINGVDYVYSGSPRSRKGFTVDDTISLIRGEDSLLLQVSHSEIDPSQVKDEAVLRVAGETFKGDSALERIPFVFSEFVPPVPVEA